MLKFENQAKASIGAFMIGSIGIIWPWRVQTEIENSSEALLTERYLPSLDVSLFYHFVLFALAWLCIYALENKKSSS